MQILELETLSEQWLCLLPPLKPLLTCPEKPREKGHLPGLSPCHSQTGFRGTLPPAALLPWVPGGPAGFGLSVSVSVLGCGGSTEGLSGLWPYLQALAARACSLALGCSVQA